MRIYQFKPLHTTKPLPRKNEVYVQFSRAYVGNLCNQTKETIRRLMDSTKSKLISTLRGRFSLPRQTQYRVMTRCPDIFANITGDMTF